jgi:hypothetical protein
VEVAVVRAAEADVVRRELGVPALVVGALCPESAALEATPIVSLSTPTPTK